MRRDLPRERRRRLRRDRSRLFLRLQARIRLDIIFFMEFLICDNSIVVCVKPCGVRSTDEPGGVPELVRAELGNPKAEVRTVHRLDQVVGGAMVLARSKAAASDLGQQVMSRRFEKEYLAVVHGAPEADCGTMTDLLWRSKPERKT